MPTATQIVIMEPKDHINVCVYVCVCVFTDSIQLNPLLRKLKPLHLNIAYFSKTLLILSSQLQVGLPKLKITRLSLMTKT
jgi:hypothetical protein